MVLLKYIGYILLRYPFIAGISFMLEAAIGFLTAWWFGNTWLHRSFYADGLQMYLVRLVVFHIVAVILWNLGPIRFHGEQPTREPFEYDPDDFVIYKGHMHYIGSD